MSQYLIAFIWLAGFLLSYWMLGVEHEAEKEEYTHGEKTLKVILSVLSFGMVIYLLVVAWTTTVKKYWNKTVKNKKPE